MTDPLKRIYYVYQYIRLDNNTVFYVGKGHGNRHISLHSRNRHFTNIINKTKCAVEIIYDNLTECEALGLECTVINNLVFEEGYGININGHRGHAERYLVNQTWGGEGVSGFNPWENLSEESKERLRKIARETRTGRKHSIETRMKISEKLKGENNYFYGLRKFGKDHHNYGKEIKQETRMKISEKLKGKYTGESSHLFKKAIIREDLHGGNQVRYCGNAALENDGFNSGNVGCCCRGENGKNRVSDYIFYFEKDNERRYTLLENNKNSLTSEQLKYRDERIIELKPTTKSNIAISNILTNDIGVIVTPKHVDSVWYRYKKKEAI